MVHSLPWHHFFVQIGNLPNVYHFELLAGTRKYLPHLTSALKEESVVSQWQRQHFKPAISSRLLLGWEATVNAFLATCKIVLLVSLLSLNTSMQVGFVEQQQYRRMVPKPLERYNNRF